MYISQSRVAKVYNKHMGGVDLLDRFISDYGPQLCSKKRRWSWFANFLNMSVDGWIDSEYIKFWVVLFRLEKTDRANLNWKRSRQIS